MNTLFTALRPDSSLSARATLLCLLLSCLMLAATPARAQATQTLLLMGDSLSAAYGVEADTAWAARLQERLDERIEERWQVINASISGETTDGGARRLPELLARHDPDLVIIELGGNDGLRGFQPDVIRQNLNRMITDARTAGADVMLVGMEIPPNYGRRYTELFSALYPALAEKHDIALVAFFLDGIYDQPGMMQDDGIHPTDAAQPLLLDNIWPVLEPLLQKNSSL